MTQDYETEIRKKLKNSRFYGALNGLDWMEASYSEYTIYTMNGTDSIVHQLFCEMPLMDAPSIDSENGQASASVDSGFDFVKPTSQQVKFDETIKIGKDRYCQVCDRPYKNQKHSHQFKDNHTCCVCRNGFEDQASLLAHVHQFIKATPKICCKCSMVLTDDPARNKSHFDRHRKN